MGYGGILVWRRILGEEELKVSYYVMNLKNLDIIGKILFLGNKYILLNKT